MTSDDMSIIFSLMIFVGIVTVLVVIATVATSRTTLSRDQRKELRESRKLLSQIEATAIRNKDIEPMSNEVILNLINDRRLKELDS